MRIDPLSRGICFVRKKEARGPQFSVLLTPFCLISGKRGGGNPLSHANESNKNNKYECCDERAELFLYYRSYADRANEKPWGGGEGGGGGVGGGVGGCGGVRGVVFGWFVVG